MSECLLVANGSWWGGWGGAYGDAPWLVSCWVSAREGVDGWVGGGGDGTSGGAEWEGCVLSAVELCGTEEEQEGDGDTVQVGVGFCQGGKFSGGVQHEAQR